MSSFVNSIVRGFGSQIGRTAASETIHYTTNSGGIGTFLKVFIGIPIVLIVLGIGSRLFYLNYTDTGKDEMHRVKIENAAFHAKETADSLTKANSNVEYYKGHIVYTGPRGGRYYLTKSGRKHYL